MYEKLYTIFASLLKPKRVISFTFLLTSIFLVFLTLNTIIKDEYFFFYPEKQYQKLEEEAIRIVKSGNLETTNEYYLRIIHYKPMTNHLYMKLSKDSLSISINVDNYKASDEQISFQRNHKSSLSFIIYNASFLIFFSFLPAMFIIFILLILILLAFLVTIFLEKTTELFIK